MPRSIYVILRLGGKTYWICRKQPLFTIILGAIGILLLLVIRFKLNAFIALLLASIFVGIPSSGELQINQGRTAFGSLGGKLSKLGPVIGSDLAHTPELKLIGDIRNVYALSMDF